MFTQTYPKSVPIERPPVNSNSSAAAAARGSTTAPSPAVSYSAISLTSSAFSASTLAFSASTVAFSSSTLATHLSTTTSSSKRLPSSPLSLPPPSKRPRTTYAFSPPPPPRPSTSRALILAPSKALIRVTSRAPPPTRPSTSTSTSTPRTSTYHFRNTSALIPTVPKPSSSSSSSSSSSYSSSPRVPTSTALITVPKRRPTPTDHIFNCTYTYGYNFGYIASGFASLGEARMQSLGLGAGAGLGSGSGLGSSLGAGMGAGEERMGSLGLGEVRACLGFGDAMVTGERKTMGEGEEISGETDMREGQEGEGGLEVASTGGNATFDTTARANLAPTVICTTTSASASASTATIPSTCIPSTYVPTTSTSPSTSTLSLTFSSTHLDASAGEEGGVAGTKAAGGVHPFSPYYKRYIELVASGGLNTGGKAAEFSGKGMHDSVATLTSDTLELDMQKKRKRTPEKDGGIGVGLEYSFRVEGERENLGVMEGDKEDDEADAGRNVVESASAGSLKSRRGSSAGIGTGKGTKRARVEGRSATTALVSGSTPMSSPSLGGFTHRDDLILASPSAALASLSEAPSAAASTSTAAAASTPTPTAVRRGMVSRTISLSPSSEGMTNTSLPFDSFGLGSRTDIATSSSRVRSLSPLHPDALFSSSMPQPSASSSSSLSMLAGSSPSSMAGIGGTGMMNFDYNERPRTPGIFTSSGGIGQGSGRVRGSRNAQHHPPSYSHGHANTHGGTPAVPYTHASAGGYGYGFSTGSSGNAIIGFKTEGVRNPKPKGLWRVRGTGPVPPPQQQQQVLPASSGIAPLILSGLNVPGELIDVRGKGKGRATNSATPGIRDTPEGDIQGDSRAKDRGSARRRRRLRREGDHEHRWSPGAEEQEQEQEQDMSSSSVRLEGDGLKNLKRRRRRRGRNGPTGGDDEAAYSDSGSSSSSSSSGSSSASSCNSSGSESEAEGADGGGLPRRAAVGGRKGGGMKKRQKVVGGIEGDGGEGHHARRHRDHGHADDRSPPQHMQSRNTLLSASSTLVPAPPSSPAPTTSTITTTTTATTTSPGVATPGGPATTANRAIPQLDDLSDARKHFTRSKIMDTSSLAWTRFSEPCISPTPDAPHSVANPESTTVTYEDWEDLKEVWAGCLEIVDAEDPVETLPLLRGIIHECCRFLQAYDDPSVVFLVPHLIGAASPNKSNDPLYSQPTRVDSGVGPDSPSQNLIPADEILPSIISSAGPPQATHSSHIHSKDPPTAFHSLLGMALFFFGNIIASAPHLALEGEPISQAFYHLYALDVFEMGENLPARTGSSGIGYTGYGEELGNGYGGYIGSAASTLNVGDGGRNDAVLQAAMAAVAAHHDCCGLGSREDWRMSIAWGRTLVSLAEELLGREKLCEELYGSEEEQRPREEDEGYFAFGNLRSGYGGGRPVGRPQKPAPANPASFLSEDFVSGGMVGGGYFQGTGGRGMGLAVDGMGGLCVDGPSSVSSRQLPSAVFPLSSIARAETPQAPAALPPNPKFPTPGVSAPFSSLSLGGITTSASTSSTPGSSTLSTVSISNPLQPHHQHQFHLHAPQDDPRRSWKKDSPFVVIRSRMPPVTRRMTLGAGPEMDGLPTTPQVYVDAPSGTDNIVGDTSPYSLSWWNDLEEPGNGRYPSSPALHPRSLEDEAEQTRWTRLRKMRDHEKEQKRRARKRLGASVDELMTLAVDQFSRGVLHMPRTGSVVGGHGPQGLGAKGARSRSHRHTKRGHKHRHHHAHSHRHRHVSGAAPPITLDASGAPMGSYPQPFSRASHLLTIAIEVLMLAEKLPNVDSRYRWARYADSVFKQMRLEESPGANVVGRNFDGDGMDVDEDDGHDSGDMYVEDDAEKSLRRRIKKGKSKSGTPGADGTIPFSLQTLDGTRYFSQASHFPSHKSRSHSRRRHQRSHAANPPSTLQGQANPVFLDSNNNAVILKARGNCALIIGGAVAEERVEVWLDHIEDEEGDGQASPPSGGDAARSNAKSKVEKRMRELLTGEDAIEARERLREAIELLEKARGVWRDGVASRRREREKIKMEVENERERRERAARAASAAAAAAAPAPAILGGKSGLGGSWSARKDLKGKSGSRSGGSSGSGSLAGAAKRRGIGALAAENKKKRKERTKGKEKEKEGDAMAVVEDDSVDNMQVDADLEMGDVGGALETLDPPATPTPLSVLAAEGSTISDTRHDMSAEEEDAHLLALFADEEEEEEGEEREFAKLIAEALVTLANILYVSTDAEEDPAFAARGGDRATEKEREELYRKAKEEMRRGGVESVDDII